MKNNLTSKKSSSHRWGELERGVLLVLVTCDSASVFFICHSGLDPESILATALITITKPQLAPPPLSSPAGRGGNIYLQV